ncbi:16S rRNA (cytosine(1402)-N(4))-methyltransferase RsmH [Thermoleophilia bacterium SCSIO 60948]|nr:16S rRNA (cytosine(1402)-N(4))-methyltransferase RsmH [Thermoleophilia bacterium SCSIO 60948]
MPTGHEPVLADELIELVDPQPGERAVDCTFGFGGHAEALADRIGPTGELIAIDRDPSAELRFNEIEPELAAPATFVRAEFSEALAELASAGTRPDVIVLDLGVSSMQLDQAERGFSYSFDAPLDMRMDPTAGTSAAEAVNEWTETRLAEVLRDFGEERHARSIAREIVARRPFETTGELVEAIRDAVPPAYRFGRGHPAKRSFQALRIAVNDELGSLARALPTAWEMLAIGGRLAVISFHSLEDRPVKRFLAERSRGCVCPPELPECRCGGEPEATLLSRRAVVAADAELERNPRASSARLRVARKLTGPRI